MSREDQIIGERKRKVAELRESKTEPYAYKFDKKFSISEISIPI